MGKFALLITSSIICDKFIIYSETLTVFLPAEVDLTGIS